MIISKLRVISLERDCPSCSELAFQVKDLEAERGVLKKSLLDARERADALYLNYPLLRTGTLARRMGTVGPPLRHIVVDRVFEVTQRLIPKRALSLLRNLVSRASTAQR